MKHGLAEVKKRAKWLTHKHPEHWGAILVSDNTRVFYGRVPGQVEEQHLANVFGFFRAGLEEHLPVALVNDWNLTSDDLAKYKLLVLPNAACLDDRQCAAIEQFVARGGGLVASLDTGLCDEFGTPRKVPALAEVLGVKHKGIAVAGKVDDKIDENFARTLPPEYWQKRKGVWDFQAARRTVDPFLGTDKLTELIGKGGLVTFKGPVARSNRFREPSSTRPCGRRTSRRPRSYPRWCRTSTGPGGRSPSRLVSTPRTTRSRTPTTARRGSAQAMRSAPSVPSWVRVERLRCAYTR